MPSKDVLLQEIQDLRSKESVFLIGEMLGGILIIAGMVILFYTGNLLGFFRLLSLGPLIPPFGVIFSGVGILAYSASMSSKCQVKKAQLMKQLESMTPSCPKCGKEVSPEFNVCPYCGEKLKS